MKKICLFLAFLLQISFALGQDKVYAWGPWVQNPCFKGLQSRSKVKDYNSSAKQYTWDIEIKNNYGSKVSFNFDIQNSSIDGRTSINSGGVVKIWTLNPSNTNLYVDFSKVCFDPNDYCSINSNGIQNKGYKCFAECDNGTAKIPSVCGNTSSSETYNSTSTISQNDLTAYNNSKADLERQMAEKNAEGQRETNRINNQRKQYITFYNEGVSLGNTGKHSEAASKYQEAINLATNETERQQAQNAYNKISKANKQQKTIQVINEGVNLAGSIGDIISDLKNYQQEKEENEERIAIEKQADYEANPGKLEFEKYLKARFTDHNYKKAKYYLIQSAIKDYSRAIDVLGQAYELGNETLEVTQDYKNAYSIYKLGLDNSYGKNDDLAYRYSYIIGKLFFIHGDDWKDKKYSYALQAFTISLKTLPKTTYNNIKENLEYINSMIGNIYENGGNGVDKNIEKAAEFYENSDQMSQLSFYLRNKNENENYSIKSKILLEKIENSNSFNDVINIGRKFLLGESLPKETFKAETLFNKAVKLDEKNCGNSAYSIIGKYYVEADKIDIAESWFSKIKKCKLEKNDRLYIDFYYIGLFYYKLNNPNYERSAFWFQKSFDENSKNNTDASYWLGYLYFKGFGVEQNNKKALKFLKPVCEDKYADEEKVKACNLIKVIEK